MSSGEVRVTMPLDTWKALRAPFVIPASLVERRCEVCEEGTGTANAAECSCDAGWVQDDTFRDVPYEASRGGIEHG